jgi:hypothetical protein
MLRTSQRYLHALHDSRIVWVGNPLMTPAIFGNSCGQSTLSLRRHFVDPQAGRSDPDAHAVSPVLRRIL